MVDCVIYNTWWTVLYVTTNLTHNYSNLNDAIKTKAEKMTSNVISKGISIAMSILEPHMVYSHTHTHTHTHPHPYINFIYNWIND